MAKKEGPGQIDSHIRIMVKTPNPLIGYIKPKNYRFGLKDPV
jgi:hypothetical protein